MLGKPLSHLRPLLRLQTHAQPDLFTSNPSLLHHFPQQGGHAIVQAGQSSAQATAGGNTGNAGRAGWGGGGAGTGGNGYTGHARAFLSIPQTSAVDPSTGISDDTIRDQELATLHRTRRFQATRFAQSQTSTQVVSLEEGGGNRIWIEGRDGGLLRAITMEDGLGEVKVIDSGSNKGRRSSIAYPQTSARIGDSKASVSGMGMGRRELVRSTSSMDVGLGRPTQLRAYSDRTTTIPLPELVDESTESIPIHITPSSTTRARLIPQPNRVLMDLAGRDLPTPSKSRRYNSSLASESQRATDDLPLPPLPSSSSASTSSSTLTTEEIQQKKMERNIYHGIIGNMHNKKNVPNSKEYLASIVAHYRSSRQLAPLDPRKIPGDPQLISRYPLPNGYDVGTYNACLQALMALRRPGESIAKVLEAYNEMLERDVLPNIKTYQIVIDALCAREQDVWIVVQRWEKEAEWVKWRAEGMGREYVPDKEQLYREELIKGYKAEGNLESALRLISAARVLAKYSKWSFSPDVYRGVLKTIATQTRPNLGAMRKILTHAVTRLPKQTLGFYRFVFEALGRAGHSDELELMWKQFREAEIEAEGKDGLLQAYAIDPTTEGVEDSPEKIAIKIRGARVSTYQVAIKYFAMMGKVELAEEIVGLVESQGRLVNDAYSALIIGITSRDPEAGISKYDQLEPKILETPAQRLPKFEMLEFIDQLIRAGHWRKAISLLESNTDAKINLAPADLNRIRHIYQGIIIGAKHASTSTEASEILDHIPPLLMNGNHFISAFPIRDHLIVLQQHGLWTDGENLFRQFRPSTIEVDAWKPWLTPYFIAAAEHLTTAELLRQFALAHDAGLEVLEDPSLVELFVDKYVADRTSVSSEVWREMTDRNGAKGWVMLPLIVRKLRGERYESGDFDAFIEGTTEDISAFVKDEIRLANFDQRFSQALKGRMEKVVGILHDRFGPTRAEAMLKELDMVGGKASTQRRSRESEDGVDKRSNSTSIGSDSPSDTFTLPSPPSSFTTTSSPPPVKAYANDRDISATIDSHLGKAARMTASGAYDLIYRTLAATGSVPGPSAIARLINTLGREGSEDKVLNLYALAQSILESQDVTDKTRRSQWCEVENHMLIASCHLGQLERAGSHRQRIIDAGMIPTNDAYATMIASSKDTTDDASVARALFDESQSLGVIPNLYLYNTIISKLSRARKAELALDLFSHMKAAGITPSSVTYGAVINACCRVGDSQSAETLFDEMRSQRNFKPRVPPYNTMMQFFVNNAPSREKVLHYYNLLRQANVPPSAHTYKLLLDAYATLPPIELVSMERVYSELLSDRSVRVQGTHTASLITAYGIYGDDLAKSMEIFESFTPRSTSTASSSSDQTDDAVVWESILNVIAHKGSLPDLEAMRTRMFESNIKPTAYVYNVLITGYTRLGRIEEARKIFEIMGDSITGVAAPNNHPILLTSSGYIKPQTITEIPTNIIFREPSTYEAMIRAEITVGNLDRAKEILGRMEARGYPWAVYMRVKNVVDEASIANFTLPTESTPTQ